MMPSKPSGSGKNTTPPDGRCRNGVTAAAFTLHTASVSRVRLIAAAVLGCCIPCAACGGHGLGAPPASADASATAAPPEQPPAAPGQPFPDNPSILRSRPLPFDSWNRSGDGLRLHFTLGSPDCYGVHADVNETVQTVVVGLRTGELPPAAGRVCTMIAVFGTLEVPLQGPLGDRQVLSVS